jgi:hypothetical protein
MSSINDQLDREYAQAWRPAPGDKLVGEITDLSVFDAGYGDYPVVTVRTDDGTERSFHALHEVAQSELARVRPAVGDRIGVRYDGKHADRGYHRYRVRSEADAAFDWGRFGGDTGGAADTFKSDVPAHTEGLEPFRSIAEQATERRTEHTKPGGAR